MRIIWCCISKKAKKPLKFLSSKASIYYDEYQWNNENKAMKKRIPVITRISNELTIPTFFISNHILSKIIMTDKGSASQNPRIPKYSIVMGNEW